MGFDTLIRGVAHIGIRVHELERSRSFYESLGFAWDREYRRYVLPLRG